MKKTLCNVRVFAENNRKKDGLLLYIEFSGQKEFLMVHRPDGILYSLLKDGCSVNELNRLVPQKYISRRTQSKKIVKRQSEHLSRSLRHLNAVITEYLEYRESEAVA